MPGGRRRHRKKRSAQNKTELFTEKTNEQKENEKNSEDNCRYYGSMIGCSFGNNCQYSHDDPNSVPMCSTFEQITKCSFGHRCKFRHFTHKQVSEVLVDNNNSYMANLIVFGYIRQKIQIKTVIPSDITQLCLIFYFKKKQYLFTWHIINKPHRLTEQFILYNNIVDESENNKSETTAELQFFKTQTFFKNYAPYLILSNDNVPDVDPYYFSSWDQCGIDKYKQTCTKRDCWISDKIYKSDLPKWMLSLTTINREFGNLTEYHYIIRMDTFEFTQPIGIYLCDFTNFNKKPYLFELLSTTETSEIMGTIYRNSGVVDAIFDNKHQQLLAMGGKHHQSLFSYDIHDGYWYQFNHVMFTHNTNIPYKYNGRKKSALCLVEDNNKERIFFCVGGTSFDGGYDANPDINTIEYCCIDNENSKTQIMKSTLNVNRSNSGIYVYDNNTIIIGGGSGGSDKSQTIEYIDLNKPDKWILYPHKTQNVYDYKPCIWTNYFNQNILYITDNTKKQIEWIDWRISNKWSSFTIKNKKVTNFQHPSRYTSSFYLS